MDIHVKHDLWQARILIVDDSLTVTKSLSKSLRASGLLPIECTDGASALYLAKQHRVEMVLLDLVMPGLDGLEVLKQLRAEAELKWIPVVMITAQRDDEQQLIRCLEAGADDYITKPFQEAVLLARLRTHLRSFRLMQELEEANFNLKQAKEQEIANTRWRAAVEMAGATAHKLNQPLTSIVCYADLLLKKMSPGDEDYKAMQQICSESDRMATILRKMAELTKVRTSEYVGGATIVDLDRSFEKTNPGIFLSPDVKKDKK